MADTASHSRCKHITKGGIKMNELSGYKKDEIFGGWIYFEQYKSDLDGLYYYSKYEVVRDKKLIVELEKGNK
jgi:hypothetical protein